MLRHPRRTIDIKVSFPLDYQRRQIRCFGGSRSDEFGIGELEIRIRQRITPSEGLRQLFDSRSGSPHVTQISAANVSCG